eukprot:scaffold25012_cov58-Phaeocystis_antarctica.AAC.2
MASSRAAVLAPSTWTEPASEAVSQHQQSVKGCRAQFIISGDIVAGCRAQFIIPGDIVAGCRAQFIIPGDIVAGCRAQSIIP